MSDMTASERIRAARVSWTDDDARNWASLKRWLRSDGVFFVDAAVTGEALLYDAEELLEDSGIPASRENLRRLAREVDALAQEV